MSFKYIVLNFLVLFVVLMVGIENYQTWTQPIELLSGHQETEKKSAVKVENPPAAGPNKETASLRSFIVISEKNIFSPERKDFPILTVEKSNPMTRPQVILYGITIAGDFQAASLVNPGRPLRKGERETMTVRIGEKVGEYKLAKIQPDRITMEANGDSFEVLLYDARNPKRRTEVKTEVKPPTVINTQPAPALPSPPAAAAAPTTTPAQAPASASPPASVEKATPAASAEKPKEPQQQQIAPVTPTLPRRPVPRLWRQGRGTPAYPPTTPPTGASGQPTQ